MQLNRSLRTARRTPSTCTTVLTVGIAFSILVGACSRSTPALPTTAASSTRAPTTGTPVPLTPPSESPVPSQKPVPAESNPPGDIPDNTVFVPYTAKAGGFSIKVPEGWARATASSSVTFTSALNSVEASWTATLTAPTVASAKTTDVPALRQSELAFTLQSVKSVTLSGGSAVLITFQENSPPNAVTGKQYRMDVERFELSRAGTEAILTLTSPVGADNVDPWRTVSESFRWI